MARQQIAPAPDFVGLAIFLENVEGNESNDKGINSRSIAENYVRGEVDTH